MKNAILSIFTVIFLASTCLAGSLSVCGPSGEVKRSYVVIADSWNDTLAVETKNNTVWLDLVQMYIAKNRRFVCGTVERYNNKWGFRLRPDTVFVTDVTAEALQTYIKYVKGHLSYWLNNTACFSSHVVKVYC